MAYYDSFDEYHVKHNLSAMEKLFARYIDERLDGYLSMLREWGETQRYVEIYLNSIDSSPYISGGAQPELNQQNLYKILIPLPSFQKQKEIVEILDRFDTLCINLSSGLPAEIEARQKQYEYYRDKLLTLWKKRVYCLMMIGKFCMH